MQEAVFRNHPAYRLTQQNNISGGGGPHAVTYKLTYRNIIRIPGMV
jgi:hypothetical protein